MVFNGLEDLKIWQSGGGSHVQETVALWRDRGKKAQSSCSDGLEDERADHVQMSARLATVQEPTSLSCSEAWIGPHLIVEAPRVASRNYDTLWRNFGQM